MALFVDELPHAGVDEVFALLQSTPALDAVYEGVIAGCDIMLLIPIAGLLCCCTKVGLPMPGLEGLIAGKEEFKELKLLSGVMARLLP